jgi:hypothetical protein
VARAEAVTLPGCGGGDERRFEMSDVDPRGGLRARGEEALGELAQALLENPVFNQALTGAIGAGSRAMHAQRSALQALNLPSSADMERLAHRLRSLSDRLEELEDRLDELADDVGRLRGGLSEREGAPGPETRAGKR